MLIYNLRVTQARCRRVGREVATAPIADYKVTTLQRWSDVRTTARKLESEIRNLHSKGRWGEDWISADRFLIWFEIFEKAWIGLDWIFTFETIFFKNQWDTLNYDPTIKLWPHKKIIWSPSTILVMLQANGSWSWIWQSTGCPKKMLLSDIVVLAFSSAWFVYFTAFLRSTLQILIELLAHEKRNWELFCIIERLSAKFWILSKTSYWIVFNTFNS